MGVSRVLSKKTGSSKSNDLTLSKSEALELNRDIVNKQLVENARAEIRDSIGQMKNCSAEDIIKKEREAIHSLQKNPELFVKTIKEVQKEVAGEEDTIAALIIVTTTRLVDNAISESTNLLLSDKTGLGKDHITKKTLDVIIPSEEHLHFTKMSPESFTYWHYKEEGWTWDKKVIHFEDITQNLLNCSTFKVMASGDNFAVVVKDQKTIEIPINGKPCMILTSHHANPKDEALRRFRIGALNDTEEQTQRIKDKISRRYSKKERQTEDNILRVVIQDLKSYSVVIPFAELIQHFFPDNDIMRTHYHCFLDYICSSAVFHQFQREKTESGEIIANQDDYMIARMVLIYTTSNPLMIPLSRELRDLCKFLEENVEPMTFKEIDIKFYKNETWLRRNIDTLIDKKIIVKSEKLVSCGNASKPAAAFQYAPESNVSAIPTWNQIIKKIEEIIEKTVNAENTELLTTEEENIKNWYFHYMKEPKELQEKWVKSVFSPMLKPSNGRIRSVFSVFSQFLQERDEKRYQRYYTEKKNKKSIQQTVLNEKIKDCINIIQENPEDNYELIESKYGSFFVVKAIEKGIFIEKSLGRTLVYMGRS